MEKKLGKLLLAVAVAGIVVVGCQSKTEEASAPAPVVTEEKTPEVVVTPAPAEEVKEEAAAGHTAAPAHEEAVPAAKH